MTERNRKYALWLDLETTGSKVEEHKILEIGMLLCENKPNYPVLDEFQAINLAGVHHLPITTIDPVVLEMHARNGLWRDLIQPAQAADDLYKAASVADLDLSIDHWLHIHDLGTEHILLAGSGVSHFDRQFIKRYLPTLNNRLTYYAMDVGVIRRFMRTLGHELLAPAADQTTKTHRALDDARQHREEAVQWGEEIQALYAAFTHQP